MHFALIDSKPTAAASGLKGLCPGCYQPVVAKCGTERVHHWAHLKSNSCDSWWEPETEWHRSWKNNFPATWQEIFLPDARTGEKHIADVKTSHGLVAEFQHSHIDPEEQTTRENFYQNMVWVVDGTRLKRDYPRMQKAITSFRSIKPGIFRVGDPEECFPSAWLGSSVPVIFDFQGNESIGDPKDLRNNLYCLFPMRIAREAIVVVLSRKAFIDAVINGKWTQWANNHMLNIRQVSQEWLEQMNRQQRHQDSINFERFTTAMRHRKGRRF